MLGDIDRLMGCIGACACKYSGGSAFADLHSDLDAAFVFIMAECGTLSGGAYGADSIDTVIDLSLYETGVGSFVQLPVA